MILVCKSHIFLVISFHHHRSVVFPVSESTQLAEFNLLHGINRGKSEPKHCHNEQSNMHFKYRCGLLTVFPTDSNLSAEPSRIMPTGVQDQKL